MQVLTSAFIWFLLDLLGCSPGLKPLKEMLIAAVLSTET